jgi:prepilin-type N-terminal cleavage/methylation domain-containing protein
MRKISGFTFIEMSIVLVIVGLVLAGILVGQDLIDAARYRRVASELEKFTTVAQTFRNKYNCLPGDCAHAYEIFGAACGTDDADQATGCNGDGDSFITHIDYETFKAWKHLSYAELIEGDLTQGYDTTDTPVAIIGVNAPGSRWSPIATWHWSSGEMVGSSWPTGEHVLVLVGTTVNDFDYVFSGQEALILDTKYDDGFPATGNLRGDTIGCNNGSGSYTINTDNANICRLSWSAAY